MISVDVYSVGVDSSYLEQGFVQQVDIDLQRFPGLGMDLTLSALTGDSWLCVLLIPIWH